MTVLPERRELTTTNECNVNPAQREGLRLPRLKIQLRMSDDSEGKL